jgi:hypothetical protein
MSARPRETPQRVRELVALYCRTHYDVVLPDSSLAAIRIGELAPVAVREWIGADGSAVYLTACNPYSTPLTDEQNNERMAQLRRRLREDGARWLEGSAGIPGQRWSEPSVLIAGVPLARSDALADRFEQNATVVVDIASPARLHICRQDWPANLVETS